jgi:hypothetical protein
MKDVLVVFYTRTGNSEKLADEVSIKLHGDVDEIKTENKYQGFSGFIRAGFRSVRKKTDEINYKKDPSKYKIVVIVSPIWASNIPPAVRAYIEENKDSLVRYGLIINGALKDNKSAYDKYMEILPNPISEYVAESSNIEYEICQKDLEDFSDKIRFEIEKEEENE